MDMKPDEIVMCYRQAKHKGEQIKILADRNVCSIEDILKVLVDHGGYELARISRAIGSARKASAKKPYKKPEIIPEPPKPEPVPEPAKELEKEKIPPVVKRALDSGFHYLADEIDARLNRIEELKAEIAEFEKDIAALRAWEEEHT
jgi:hypothetical protein